jgi:hypothetical protein
VARRIFDRGFLYVLQHSIDIHHSIYPTVPPQGIYFEALVEKTFNEIKKPFSLVEAGGRNQPRHDLLVGKVRISLKTEIGLGTRRESITITKLCTTEREPWNAMALKERVLAHLRRYDVILMFRTIWEPHVLVYQPVEIPIPLLRLIATCAPGPVGKRTGRQSLGATVMRGAQPAFRVHFDGSDGKCSIRGLRVSDCRLLLEWERERRTDLPTHTGQTS